MRNLLHDVRSGRRPDERTRMTAVLSKVFGDGLIQYRDAMERATSDALPCDLGELLLHQVQPRAPVGVKCKW